jgi:hypothetical protein
MQLPRDRQGTKFESATSGMSLPHLREFECYHHRHSHEENGNFASVGVHVARQDAILKRKDEQIRVTLEERFRYNRSRWN